MSRTYKAQGGETWGTVARRATGNDADAAAIRNANPGLQAPLAAGNIVQIPVDKAVPGAIGDAEFRILIENQKIEAFDNFELQVAIDAISKCRFTIPNTPEMRKLLVPLGAQRIVVDAGGRRIFTGRCATPAPNNRMLDVSCYSDPAVLELGTPSIQAFPLNGKKRISYKSQTSCAKRTGSP